MKLNLTYGIFFLILLSFAFMGNSGGRATTANTGNCGAPGDEAATCITCHGTNPNVNVEIGLDFKDAGGASIMDYVPGEVYDGSVTVSVLMGNPAAFGFQAVILKAALDQDGDDAAGFSETSPNAQITSTTRSNRQYIEHNGASADSVFTFKWTAPMGIDGPVTVYACGNGVNQNGNTAGDNAACTKLEFPQRPVSARRLSQEVQLTVAPNPVGQQLNLLVASTRSDAFEATVFDLNGRALLHRQVTITAGEQRHAFPVAQLQPGFYVLRLTDGNRAMAVRFVKE